MLVYIVKMGDTLWQIAKEYRITLDALLAANPHIGDPNYVMPGMNINIPRLAEMPMEKEMPRPEPISISIPEPPSIPEPLPIPEPFSIPEPLPIPEPPEEELREREGTRPCIYVTKGGETLFSISEEWAIPLAQLHYHNYQYAQNSQLPGGERIILPMPHDYRIGMDAYAQPRQARTRRRR